MSVRRIATTHTLPPNPHWLEFPRSDGSKKQWPTNTQKIVDPQGHVNFMRPVGIDESLCIHWRRQAGIAVAKAMGLPDGPAYVLKDWPSGYAMFDHNKGPQANPRHDPYLYGTTNAPKFRSANEFVPHAIWLFTDPTMDRSNCECKYCAKKPQKAISATLGLSQKKGGSPSPSGVTRPTRLRERPERKKPPPQLKKKPYTAVRKTYRPPKKLVGPKQHMTPERNNDIRESLTKTEISTPRMYRPGELVWCGLKPPIRAPSGRPEEDIVFWPGIVDDTELKSVPIPREGSAEASQATSMNGQSDPSAEKPVPWDIRQWTVYKVKLLPSEQYIRITDQEALPYLAYAPPESLLQGIRTELQELTKELSLEDLKPAKLEHIYRFHPVPEDENQEDPMRYRKAVPSFTLAVQISSHVAKYWTPTDEWDFRFTIPAVSPPPPEPGTSHSLHSLISQAMASNVQENREAPPLSVPKGMSGPEGLTPDEMRSLAEDILGQNALASHIPRTITQIRYEGLWWGAERIWTDELVRLKLARCQFAPNGSETVYPPAGPSASTKESAEQQGGTTADGKLLGAGEKSLFMRLEALFIVDAQTPDGKTLKECRASGMLYELADEDWEDPIDTKGKGKERAVDQPPAQQPVAGGSVSQPNTPNQVGGTFMTGPTPFKLPPLPNPDPNVPASATASHALSQSTTPKPSTPGDQTPKEKNRKLGSHPVLTTPYPLPPAPRGYKFRPILPDGHEVVLSVALISGRYYPGIFEHPLLTDTVHKALVTLNTAEGMADNRHLWALEGILPGVYQSMDPVDWKPNRGVMIEASIAEAKEHMAAVWPQMKTASDGLRETKQEEGQAKEEDRVRDVAGSSGGGAASVPDGNGDVEMKDSFAGPSTSVSASISAVS
ncbi:hypothetical protein K474DRAFT_1664349 [Panus rudis PR-1116 ss-1]|nr:hypothetical protein K474DRAFT_1664349 [Panus rudis PR-1116 ss-1]